MTGCSQREEAFCFFFLLSPWLRFSLLLQGDNLTTATSYLGTELLGIGGVIPAHSRPMRSRTEKKRSSHHPKGQPEDFQTMRGTAVTAIQC